MSAAALPELHETEAPPDIAAIYAALRQASGVPLVNLIYRHIATLPGMLPWVWLAVLDTFTRQVIPAMVPIGLAFSRTLAQG